MSEQVSYRCDVCGIEKQGTNHWWKGYMVDAGQLHENKTDPAGVMIIPWDVNSFSRPFSLVAMPKPNAHLCGEGHAIEWASKNLSKR